jgi:glyoxylase-like metal-dependent hydrolase (beta-lactamase superfamily II)
MNIQSFFDAATSTITHIVFDQTGGHAAVIDPVLGFEARSGRTNTQMADQVLDFLKQNQLQLAWILETHAHADHLSSAPYLKQQAGGKIAIGARINQVQKVFSKLFGFEANFHSDGSQFDHVFEDHEIFHIGALEARVIAVPGHTPADIAYHINDAVFLGDTMFMPDVGTARCDFPGGDARQLYSSIQKILSMPASTRLMMCHDYPPTTRSVAWECSVADQKANNIHVRDGIDEDAFVAMRSKRDAGLDMPMLLLPSVQVNIRAGQFPPAEENGVSYLKLPINGV